MTALLLFASLAVSAQLPASASCEATPDYQLLSKWVGEWTVKNAAGQPVGSSKVERSPDGCGLIEHWSAAQLGTGLHAFNRSTKTWTHLWVDASGFTATLTGHVLDGAVVYERTSQQPGGIERHHRMTLAPSGASVTQTGEHSDDGGKTFSRDFQLTYARG